MRQKDVGDGAGIVYELAVDIRAVILHRGRDGERGRRRAVNGLGGFVALLIVPLYTRRAGRSGGERDGVPLGQRLAGGTHILRENGLESTVTVQTEDWVFPATFCTKQ